MIFRMFGGDLCCPICGDRPIAGELDSITANISRELDRFPREISPLTRPSIDDRSLLV